MRGRRPRERHGGEAHFYRSHHITARKLVAAYQNRHFKREAIALNECTSSLLEDTEIYSYHVYGVFVYAGADNVLRRVYANSRSYADLPALATVDTTRGDDGIILSDETKHTIVENCIGAFGHATSTGFGSTGVQNLNIESSNAYGNDTNFDFAEKFDDDTGHLQRCVSVPATAMGLSTNQCLVYVPAASSM